jgi:DNA repair photolyase
LPWEPFAQIVSEVQVQSVLTRSKLLDYCVNPYAGCANACVYCYARFATRFSHPDEHWGSFVDVRINAALALRRQLARARPGNVYMSSVCDAWQAAEARYEVSRQCLKYLLETGHPLFLQTKNALVERDFDLLAERDNVRLGVTVTTTDVATVAMFEPGASPPSERMRVLRQAQTIGLRTFVFLGPLLPGIAHRGEGLRQLMAATAELRPDSILVDRLNRHAGMWPAVARAVRAVDPALLPEYRRILFSAESADYESELRKSVARVASSFGMMDRSSGASEAGDSQREREIHHGLRAPHVSISL